MNRCCQLLLTGVLILNTPVVHADEAPTSASAAPNAAVIYWQAYAAIPKLNDDLQKKFDAAVGSSPAPLGSDHLAIVAPFKTALHELHRARSVAPCDWQLDEAAGPTLLLPHLQKARDLSHAALLRARIRFQAGETDAALSDVLDVLKLARDCGSSPIFIALLVDVALERQAQTVLTAHLPQLKPAQLESLAVALQRLPSTASMEACIRWEGRTFSGWLEQQLEAELRDVDPAPKGIDVLTAIQTKMGGPISTLTDANESARQKQLLETITVAEIRASLKQMQSDYDEMAQIVRLDATAQQSRWAELEARLATARKTSDRASLQSYFSANFLPTIHRIADRHDLLQLRRRMMEVAVQVQLHGPDAISASKPPVIEHRVTATGFELHGTNWGKPETMVIGMKR